MQYRSLRIGVFLCLAVVSAHASSPGDISVISVEAESGLILHEENADAIRPPASMIKLMLMLMVTEGMEQESWSLDTPITATLHAQRMGGTQVYLAAGETFPLSRLMDAVAVASANDAAMAVAEGLWGSEEAYLTAMNIRAAELGMAHTEFNSVHGLPPSRGENPDRTTARDMARLARECIRYPQIIDWTSQKRIVFREGKMPFRSTNKLLSRMENCDGLKTGYIRKAGFCITATATYGEFRVITVVMGHSDPEKRFRIAESQLEKNLEMLERRTVATSTSEDIPVVKIENGEVDSVRLALKDDLHVSITKELWPQVELVMDHPTALEAPIAAGTEVGEAVVRIGDVVLAKTTLLVPEELPEARWMWRVRKRVGSVFSAED